MDHKASLSGLYAITPEDCSEDELMMKTRAILEGGTRALQFRSKSSNFAEKKSKSLVLQRLCREFGALFIINDDLELAIDIASDGLHLGRDDSPLSLARQRFSGVIGISCYNDLDRAHAAVSEGADYIAFGAMAPSRSKPQAIRCPTEVLQKARSLGAPIVAIGGITLHNARALIEAGADALAVISALYDAADPGIASQQFSALWSQFNHES